MSERAVANITVMFEENLTFAQSRGKKKERIYKFHQTRTTRYTDSSATGTIAVGGVCWRECEAASVKLLLYTSRSNYTVIYMYLMIKKCLQS